MMELVRTGVAIGFAVPVLIASLAGGYILATFALGKFNGTVLGIHVRRWMTRNAPSKFFEEDFVDDRRFVIETVTQAVRDGRIKLNDRG